MLFKRIFSAIISMLIIVSLCSCNNNSDIPSEISSTIENNSTETDIEYITTNYSEPDISESSTEDEMINNEPEKWTSEQIVEYYKAAAKKSHSSTTSSHTIELKSISVNNGAYKGLFEFITPIMAKLLANNSEDKEGITGGYNNLVVSDIATAKAYKIGDNIAIEMVMQNQIAGPRENALEGSVGHAITAVGDIGVVTKQLTDLGLPLELSEKDTKIYYTNPVVKIIINGNGEIISGTWKYTVEIRMDNFKAFGKTVETSSVIMDNILTVNGGFKA